MGTIVKYDPLTGMHASPTVLANVTGKVNSIGASKKRQPTFAGHKTQKKHPVIMHTMRPTIMPRTGLLARCCSFRV
jgi:hypothetical protein